MKDPECVELLQWALPRLGLRWPGFRKVRRQVCRRLVRRLAELGIGRAAAYRAYLEEHPEEWEVLDRACRITISRFRRNRGLWEYLEESVLPELVALARRREDAELRAWCLGCASGEEPYSLRLAWEGMGGRAATPLAIVATDADPALIERARDGCYPASSLRELPAHAREEHFVRTGRLWRLGDGLRDVSFRVQDVRRGMPVGAFHLVLCRNLVFTYFDDATQRRVLAGIGRRLVVGGALVIGAHERLPAGTRVVVEWRGRRGGGVFRKGLG